jgi:hypothetical protein
MDVTVSRKHIDLVAVDAKRGFLDAVAQSIDPQWFTGPFVETVKEWRVP